MALCIWPESPQRPSRACARARCLLAPRPQPGPGPGILSPAWAQSGPSVLGRSSTSDGRASASAEQKPGAAATPRNPISFLPSPSPSMKQSSDGDHPQCARRKEVGAAAARPLAGARVHPRVSAPPSSGLAEVP